MKEWQFELNLHRLQPSSHDLLVLFKGHLQGLAFPGKSQPLFSSPTSFVVVLFLNRLLHKDNGSGCCCDENHSTQLSRFSALEHILRQRNTKQFDTAVPVTDVTSFYCTVLTAAVLQIHTNYC